MEITEVRVSPAGSREDKLKAFCSVTFDNCFVVRDIRVIEGSKGLFIAMPSRKLTVRCGGCGFKNVVRSHYCNQCGDSIDRSLSDQVEQGRSKLHADIAHPILTEFREEIQDHVLDAYENFLDDQEDGFSEDSREKSVEKPAARAPRGPLEDEQHEPQLKREKAESEARFLGKTEEKVPEPADEDSDAAMPPPDDNFSTGIF